MTIENNYFLKERGYLKLQLASDYELDKYETFLRKHGVRNPIPRGISFHKLDDTEMLNGQPCALLEPNWSHFHDWVNTLNRHSFWTKKVLQSTYLGTANRTVPMPNYLSAKVRAVLEDIIHGLKLSHDGGFYSGLLTLPNIQTGPTGIFVSSDGDAAVVVCHNQIKELPSAWHNIPYVIGASMSASTSTSTTSIILADSPRLIDPSDQFNRIREDLLGFQNLVNHLVQQFNDAATIALPIEIPMFGELYTYLAQANTVAEIKRFEIYVWRAPLFWNRTRLSKLCHFMYVVHKKNFSPSVDYSGLVGWQGLILNRGQKDRLSQIYHYQGITATYSTSVGAIIEFLRHAMVHLGRRSDLIYSFGHQEAIEIIHEQYPEWLPTLYTSLVGCLGIGGTMSTKKPFRTFHELFMEEFDA